MPGLVVVPLELPEVSVVPLVDPEFCEEAVDGFFGVVVLVGAGAVVCRGAADALWDGDGAGALGVF